MCKKNVLIGVLLAMLLLGSGVVQASLLLYEPFDYTVGELLDGQTPPAGSGMTGSWTAWDQHDFGMTIVDGPRDPPQWRTWDGVAHNVAQTGGFISVGFDGRSHVLGHITLASSVTDTFVDGSTTWMSIVAAQGDVPWGYWPMLAIGAGELLEDRGNNAAGQAIGGGVQGNSAGDGGAYYWDNAINLSVDTVPSTINVIPPIPHLWVFKITWSDTGNDTVQAFQFDVNEGAAVPTEAAFNAGAVSNSADLDQSLFTTLSYAGARVEYDEIRIGTTFEDMLGAITVLAGHPSPHDGATDVCPKVVLSWTPGPFVGALSPKHKVFLSEDFNDVNDGVGGVTQDPNRYPATGTLSLDFGKTYYWKVDEANSTTGWDEGGIWQFTVEPLAYVIDSENITASASSSNAADQGPENTINGSGLDANDMHSTVPTDMWLSGEELPPAQAWIEYEFDKVYKLHEMWVWNHNSGMEDDLGYGLEDVTIEYSENGADYTTLGTTHEFAQAPGKANYEHNTEVYFGVPAKYVKLTANSNWGGFYYKYGLSEVRFFRIPVFAGEESPESGTTIDGIDVVLSWRPGREAAEHNVYFSTSFEDVNTGTIDPDIIPAADGCRASYGPLSLELGKTYYWRIDEVNDLEEPSTWQGDVWNFTTPEYLVVDDMEAYTGRKSIRYVWHDGYVPGIAPSGSNVTVSTESDDRDPRLAGVGPPWPVRGSEAMQFAYDNDGSITLYVQPYAITSYGANANYYSEIAASTSGPNSLEVGWDWTSAKALSLWFYGEPNNAIEQMYVKLNGSKVIYDGDAGDIQQAGWQQWNIALSDFGVNLQNVTMVYIGFGDENNTTPGGSGVVYFDDIRLYPSRCILSKRSDDFARVDYVRDCVIDYKEVAVMAADWLFEATAPDAAHLLVEYTFNANNLIDTSGKNRDGIGQNTPIVHDGILTLDGTNFVDIPFGANNPFDGSQDFSIVMDFRTGQDGILISSARDANSENHAMAVYMWTDEVEGEVIYDNFYVASAGTGGETATGNNPGDGMWRSVVVTYDASEELVEIHMLDGEDWAWDGNFNPAIPNIADDTVRIGGSLNATFPYEEGAEDFVGDIDNVRIYDYVLSHEEALYISGLPVHDLNKDHIVNFKDFAELAVWWLDEQLWP